MKIVDGILTKSYTGFYCDDQKAIKAGAGHDGFMYVGDPMTDGFSSIRQAGEAISVQLVLEDGTVGLGDCAAVQYSGAGGRDPLFLAEDFIPVIGNRLKVLHVHDNHGRQYEHLAPFFGSIDWKDFSDALREVGFDGVLSLEAIMCDTLPADILEDMYDIYGRIARRIADGDL